VLEMHLAQMQHKYGHQRVKMSDIVLTIPQSTKTYSKEWLKDVSFPVDESSTPLEAASVSSITSSAHLLFSSKNTIDASDIEPEQYSVELDDLNEDGFGVCASTVETVNPDKKKKAKKKKELDKTKLKSKAALLAYESQVLQYQDEVFSALKGFVEVSVLSGQITKATSVLEHYRKKLLSRSVNSSSFQFPTWIYNALLAGYVNTENFNGAMMLRNVMRDHKTPFDAQTYSYLLAVSKDRDQKFIAKFITAMTEQNISFRQLFQESVFTKIQRENLIEAIRKVQPDFEVPVKTFPNWYECNLLKGLEASRVQMPTCRMERPVPIEVLEEGAGKQWSRELEGIIKVKSIAATKEPSSHVKFLRGQVNSLEKKWADEIQGLVARELRILENYNRFKPGMTLYPYLCVIDPKARFWFSFSREQISGDPQKQYAAVPNLFVVIQAKTEVIANMLVHEMHLMALSSESFSPGLSVLSYSLGRRIYETYVICAKGNYGVTPKLHEIYNDYLKVYDPQSKRPDREIWHELISRHSVWGPSVDELSPAEWSKGVTVGIGRFLYQILRSLKVDINIMTTNAKSAVMVNAIYSIFRDNDKDLARKEELKVHPVLAKLYRDAQIEELYFDVKMVPMSCPPRPWCNPVDSPFLMSQVPLVRVPFEGGAQRDLIQQTPRERLYPVLDALNVLSKCPWIINKPMLELITQVFLANGNTELDIPQPPGAIPVPPSPASVPKQEKNKAMRELIFYRRQCNEAYSLWCDMLYKLSIAHHFKDSVFWFPHNMDFRGRVYPCPPHFNHMGGDVVRSCLLFAQGKPLGPNGFKWLKLHLINLTGFMKKKSVADRLRYADEIMEDVLDSADHPFTGRKWWQSSDEPWQTLAACQEVAKVLRCGKDPSEFVSHFPIHQDGSCNGLQHYAALGKDIEGAAQVNLRPMDLPQDVYSGVAELVERERKKDAKNGSHIAQILEGHISRKVVKQTVMTVVYGVTRYGARLQICRQLENLDSFPKQYTHEASIYLAGKTFFSLREMFTATKQIQDWFSDCAGLVAKVRQQPVDWVTPLGLPVVQPYYVPIAKTSLVSGGEKIEKGYLDYSNQFCRPNVNKQKNAFPPNFIHSLDSSHMMLTALHAQAAGICFISVHDCFWTHPCTVDTMNKLCREQFVALHSEPILENLSSHLIRRFDFSVPHDAKKNSLTDTGERRLSRALKNVPKKGKFDIKEVLTSTYFFG
ncbi:DNA-directed RNA polymerase, partial [Tropilaelaps mercedesae]